jgi:hypothetical protein
VVVSCDLGERVYSAYHESTHGGCSLLCVRLLVWSYHVGFVIVVLVRRDSDCGKTLVSWLRGRGGGVFAMIAPSVQGIA